MMSFLTKRYWVSHLVKDEFPHAANQILSERSYLAVLGRADFENATHKIIFCAESEIAQIMQNNEHDQALCFILKRDEQENTRIHQ